MIKERIKLLRELMKENNLDAYIVPSADAHQSEYVGEHWKSRQWLSGFNGSAGTLVITLEEAGLWTDGRYYIQAEKQLEGSTIKLFKMGLPSTPSYVDWLKEVLKEGSTIGFDGRVISISAARELENNVKSKKITIDSSKDLVESLWKDRPSIPTEPIFILDTIYSGKSREEKLEEVRKIMTKKGANQYILASLDDICWLFNIRGGDIKNNPFVTAYAVVDLQCSYLFLDENKVSEEIKKELEKSQVFVKAYEKIYEHLKSLSHESKVIYDTNKINIALYNSLPSEAEKVEDINITTGLKAIKNPVEIQNLRKCHIIDSVAMIKFIKWVKEEVKNNSSLTEIHVENKLLELRKQEKTFLGPSFDTIAGYKDHAAMMHYKATEDKTYALKPEGFLLVDSGGQYLIGTTDITRTIALGPLTEEEKADFTLVLKAMIGLTKANFLYGTTGSNLDILARKPLWDLGLDYKCGTGHGVGFLSGVHEAPQRFAQVPNTHVLEKGMVITNEPGIYKENRHGIRTENTLLVVDNQITEFGEFLKFETISFCPIDIDGINPAMLTEEELEWINSYHQEVYEKLSPYVTEEEQLWLKEATRTIKK